MRPELVVEVRYDKVQGRRFRHGTKLLRMRPDKSPAQCTWRELRPPLASGDEAILRLLGTVPQRADAKSGDSHGSVRRRP